MPLPPGITLASRAQRKSPFAAHDVAEGASGTVIMPKKTQAARGETPFIAHGPIFLWF
jgi:hypothetical protein